MNDPVRHEDASDSAAAGRYGNIPRRLWKYQPRPRRILLGRSAEESPELDLLLELAASELGRHRLVGPGAGSMALHLLVIGLLLVLPGGRAPARRQELALRFRPTTSLVAPPPQVLEQLTQTRPNRGAVSAEVNLEGLLAPPGPPRPFTLPPVIAEPEARLAKPPEIEPPREAMLQPPLDLLSPGLGVPAPAPQIEPAERKPKLAFEKPGAMSFPRSAPSSGITAGAQPPAGSIQKPSSSVREAIREVARTGGGGKGLVIGDIEGIGGIIEARQLPPSRGNTGSSLELLSDPKGIDFRPYLIRVLATVRRNWYAVMPASAKLGRRGKVVIQFAIARSGNVPKLVIAVPSGAEALDRAAVAGISASNPFPPLPEEFTGDQVRLQLNFLYNVKR